MSDLHTGVPMDRLTYEDIDLILQALDALDAKSSGEAAFTMLVGGMLARDQDQAEQLIRKQEERSKSKEHLQRILRESTAILRAKLILARRDLDAAQADRILAEAAKSGN